MACIPITNIIISYNSQENIQGNTWKCSTGNYKHITFSAKISKDSFTISKDFKYRK